jgi:superfamily II DNA/RNA helicase
MDKPEVLSRILQARNRGLTMVFCQTKRTCDRVAEDLAKRGFAAAAVHGDLGQSQRERALRAFRSGKIDVLIATDVAARGLDVEDVTHVVNYECPEDEKAYVHRIGRTGRAGREGIAITLIDWSDVQRWKLINTALGLDFPAPEEIYSSSPELYAALDIPAEAGGTLPKAQRERAGLDAEELEDIGETGRNRSTGPRRDRDADEERPARAARNRVRRRTRSGRPLAEGETVEPTPAEAPAADLQEAPEARPARRRARKTAEQPASLDQPASLEQPAEQPIESGQAPEAEEKPRRRTRKAAVRSEATEQAAVQAPEQTAPAAEPEPLAEPLPEPEDLYEEFEDDELEPAPAPPRAVPDRITPVLSPSGVPAVIFFDGGLTAPDPDDDYDYAVPAGPSRPARRRRRSR